ncbi:MAG: tetraacyldisaccharide 4'-kinase [Acidobacteriaceae bacterium]
MRARRAGSRRPWGWPLAPVYAAGLAVRDGLRRVGLLRVRRLAWPVISVGSLSAGGAGKTPVVIALAELLRERGWYVDVLSRGYGRTGRGVERVDLAAADAAARFGDEPVMIARKAEIPVWVGAERFAAGVVAENEEGQGGRLLPQTITHPSTENAEGWGTRPESTDFIQGAEAPCSLRSARPRVHLLDDGFQHRGLARTVDVVLVTEEDLEDALLPAGNRRELLASLRRADVVVLREQERERVEAKVRRLMRADAAVWSVRRELRIVEGGAGARPLAFCSIARPEEFWAMLAEAGCSVVEKVAFADHYAYAMADMVRIVARAKEHGATGFLTTEKDSVKLDGAMLERLREVGLVCVAGLEARFVDEAGVVRELEGRCR